MRSAVLPMSKRGLGPRPSLARREAIEGYLYITPWILGFIIFTGGPMLVSLYLSFTNYQLVKAPVWAGVGNYVSAFRDPLFWKSLSNTFYYAFIYVPILVTGSLCCALLLNQGIHGKSLFRALYFLPSLTPAVAAALLWQWLFHPQAGLLNYYLSRIGISPGPGWLGSPQWSKPALIIISLWGGVGGGNMLIFLAGLQGIPRELHEVAEIDGAGSWGRFWNITLPLLSPSLFFNLVLGVIGALQQFTLAYVVNQGSGQQRPAGGPLYSTLFYVLNLYNHAFDYWDMGAACALAWLFFVIVMALTYVQLRVGRGWVYYEAVAGEAKW